MENSKIKIRKVLFTSLLVAEVVLILVLLFMTISPFVNVTDAGVGNPNTTITTLMNIGRVYPEILNMTVNNGTSTLTLSPNATVPLYVNMVARDYDGATDIINATLVFYNSTLLGTDQNRNHYTNNSCSINYTALNDPYLANITCLINVQYYSNVGFWVAFATVTDNMSEYSNRTGNLTINSLMALGLPDSLNYGTVNATQVSDEQMINVTNFGNIQFNLSIQGYANTKADNLSMNCTLGTVKNISLAYERYNVNASFAGNQSLTQFTANYTNITGYDVIKKLERIPRQTDTAPYVDDTNSTYWRVYVPMGVAGTCRGNLLLGAVQSVGS